MPNAIGEQAQQHVKNETNVRRIWKKYQTCQTESNLHNYNKFEQRNLLRDKLWQSLKLLNDIQIESQLNVIKYLGTQ